MAKIEPFNGYRYNTEKIENLGLVMAPPYDSLSEESTDKYFDLDPYNAVRLISQKSYPDDNDEVNCYTRSAECLKNWINEEILKRDEEKAIYIYEQIITVNRESYYNRGVVALLELRDYHDNVIIPCEEPSTNSKIDRYNMIKETGSNNSLISCIYFDRERQMSKLLTEISEKLPTVSFDTINGITHKLWAVTNKPTIEFVRGVLADKKMYIVDGHNRYEASLEYRDYVKNNDPNYSKNNSYNYVMALISDNNEDGRIHMPIHRLIKFKKEFNESFFITGAQEFFLVEKIIVDTMDEDIEETMRKQIATQRKETKIALYTGKSYFYRLTYKKTGCLDKSLSTKSEQYKSLDLTILNKLLLEDLLYITNENSDERVFYTKNTRSAMKLVEKGEYGCMFMVNPIKSSQIEEVIANGEKLPKRSVSVFPRPATGVVINKFSEL